MTLPAHPRTLRLQRETLDLRLVESPDAIRPWARLFAAGEMGESLRVESGATSIRRALAYSFGALVLAAVVAVGAALR